MNALMCCLMSTELRRILWIFLDELKDMEEKQRRRSEKYVCVCVCVYAFLEVLGLMHPFFYSQEDCLFGMENGLQEIF